MKIAAFIQARMSSRRFPGKVLVPFLGRPIIDHVVERIRSVDTIDSVVVLTSTEASDDPLVQYLDQSGIDVFRGSLLNVFERFQMCATRLHPDWVLRICADSPLISPRVVEEVIRNKTVDCDLVTTRFAPRFPKGQNVELIRTDALLQVDPMKLTEYDLEHVTPWFYRNQNRYKVSHAGQVELEIHAKSFSVDTPEDLQQLEILMSQSS